MLSLLVTTYAAVLVAELLGDKALYTISTLSARYRVAPVLCGVLVAFMAKMAAAVLLGRAIAELPVVAVTALSVGTFFGMALVLWLRKPSELPVAPEAAPGWTRPVLVSFAAIFFSEWGDVGQITAATLAARYRMPGVVWAGATLALGTKALLALTVGLGLRRWVPLSKLRYVGLCTCVAMGTMALFRIEL